MRRKYKGYFKYEFRTDDLTEAMNSIQRNGVCLKGNIVTQWPIHKSRNLLLR